MAKTALLPRRGVDESKPRFLAHLRDGRTANFNGFVPSGTTAVTVEWRGVSVAVGLPRSFSAVEWEVETREDNGEIVADVLYCYAGEVCQTVLFYRRTGMVRIGLRRLGKRSFKWQQNQER